MIRNLIKKWKEKREKREMDRVASILGGLPAGLLPGLPAGLPVRESWGIGPGGLSHEERIGLMGWQTGLERSPEEKEFYLNMLKGGENL